ncbi:hypothetical protein [Microcoleus sp. FACHB-672]|uniref:hypothetical protein n=1 Tax=Microcoleus sp. FACHB-672 TaxID=2692825 RepID=UPI0018EFDBC7|nr:hypothetical protein [Microcoleus sp. FACHB-672]
MLSSECSFTATKPTVEPASIATYTFLSSAAQTSKGSFLPAHTPIIGIKCLVHRARSSPSESNQRPESMPEAKD